MKCRLLSSAGVMNHWPLWADHAATSAAFTSRNIVSTSGSFRAHPLPCAHWRSQSTRPRYNFTLPAGVVRHFDQPGLSCLHAHTTLHAREEESLHGCHLEAFLVRVHDSPRGSCCPKCGPKRAGRSALYLSGPAVRVYGRGDCTALKA